MHIALNIEEEDMGYYCLYFVGGNYFEEDDHNCNHDDFLKCYLMILHLSFF